MLPSHDWIKLKSGQRSNEGKNRNRVTQKKLSKKEKSIGARKKTLRSENDSKPAKLVDGKLPSSPAYDVIGGRDPT